MASPRGWSILLLGGPSGSGKTTLAERLGRRFGLPWLQVDDLRLALQWSGASLPRDTEALYFFLEQTNVWTLPPERLRDALVALGEALAPALDVVIDHHVSTERPLILEGDAILPSLLERPTPRAHAAAGRLRAVFLVERDEEALLRAMRARGRGIDASTPWEQQAQAGMNVLYGHWLAGEAARLGLPVLDPRPWETLAGRVEVATA